MHISIFQLSEICQGSSVCCHCSIKDSSDLMAAKPKGLSVWLHVLNVLNAARLSLSYLSWLGFWDTASLPYLFYSVLDFPRDLYTFPWGLYAFSFWSEWSNSKHIHLWISLGLWVPMSVVFKCRRYLLKNLFIIISLAFSTLILAPSLPFPSGPYHVLYRQSNT